MLKNVYKSICNWLSIKNITWISVGIFILTLFPICYLSFVNRASGDDYGYGVFTRAAWIASHSLVEVIKAAIETVKQSYNSWQGTWFDLFLFALQPEVFSDKAYFIVVFIMLFLWCGTTWLLFREIFGQRLQMEKWCFRLITVLFMLINIQYIPSTKSSIFWFNGCAHYMIPFVMCQLLAYMLLKYTQEYKNKYWLGIFVFMILLGGANYQAALFGLIITFYIGIVECGLKKTKKAFGLLIPIVAELIGLIISFMSPGNKNRGGEDFGFSISLAVKTIMSSFDAGIRDIGGYYEDKPIIFIVFIVIFLIFLESAKKKEVKTNGVGSAFVILAVFCLYSAMQAPAIYAGVEVSGGVYNMNYQCFLLMMIVILYIFAEMVGNGLKRLTADTIHEMIVIPGMILCFVLLIFCKSNIKDSTTWKCLDYIVSGQASDYKKQMDIQTKLMTDENATDVIVPYINEFQGPLMHMPVIDNKEAWTNTVTSRFYGKNSVIAVERPVWESMQKEQQEK